MKNPTGNINARFKDLVAESFDFVQFSFKTDIGITNSGAIALEMAELKADNEAKIEIDWFQAMMWKRLIRQQLSLLLPLPRLPLPQRKK